MLLDIGSVSFFDPTNSVSFTTLNDGKSIVTFESFTFARVVLCTVGLADGDTFWNE